MRKTAISGKQIHSLLVCALLVAGLFRLHAQSSQSAVDVDRPVVNVDILRKAAAVNKVVEAFNRLGMNAVDLRKAMSLDEAAVFDGAMIDIMAALSAVPQIGLKNWHNPETIKPERPRLDRLGQLPAKLAVLEKLFSGLLAENHDRTQRKMLLAAKSSVERLIATLPEVVPVVAVTPRSTP
jgi:hypothetical protein